MKNAIVLGIVLATAILAVVPTVSAGDDSPDVPTLQNWAGTCVGLWWGHTPPVFVDPGSCTAGP